MRRKRPFPRCERQTLPQRLRADIVLRQAGRCADCGARLILGSFIFDHRPPLALREAHDDPNDPARLAAICKTCDARKTPRDLKDIAKTKRVADAHLDFVARQKDKVPGRRVPSRSQWRALEHSLGAALQNPADEGPKSDVAEIARQSRTARRSEPAPQSETGQPDGPAKIVGVKVGSSGDEAPKDKGGESRVQAGRAHAGDPPAAAPSDAAGKTVPNASDPRTRP